MKGGMTNMKEARIKFYVERTGFCTEASLIFMALAVVAVSLLKVAAIYGFRVSNARGGETLVKNMRDTLYRHIERLPFQWHMQNHTGDIIQRCTSDIDTTRNFISEQLTPLIRILFMVVLSIVFMLGMNVPLTFIAMAPLPVIVWYSLFFHRKFRKGFQECDENEGKLSAMVQENLTGVRVVRAFGRERYERDRFGKQNNYYTSLWVKLGRLMAYFRRAFLPAPGHDRRRVHRLPQL